MGTKDTRKVGRSILEADSTALKYGDLHCIGDICFTPDGIVVKIPQGADPKCAELTAKSILGGQRVKFELEGRADQELEKAKEIAKAKPKKPKK
ncbi:unnamed protein product [marine sediment metagenome]|uniref:Uncharacterized protein n=1 Tax=marine sediment metagenome TaxID=412755 RepID=X1LQA6_9ZZZZ